MNTQFCLKMYLKGFIYSNKVDIFQLEPLSKFSLFVSTGIINCQPFLKYFERKIIDYQCINLSYIITLPK